MNWVSIGTIVGLVTLGFMMVTWFQARIDKKRRDAANLREERQAKEAELLREEFTTAITHLGEMLSARLETKETVARISERLASVEGRLASAIPSDR